MAGRRVVVTGAGGFVGGAVMRAVGARGDSAIGLYRCLPGVGAPEGEVAVADLATDPLCGLLADLRPDVIIHCAGRTVAPDGDEGRASLRAANLTATVRLIEAAARLARPPRLVIVSSAAIYAPMGAGLTAMDEDHPMGPVSAYGIAKAEATRHALTTAARLGLDLAVAVPFNVIGPGQPGHLVPQLFANRLRADPEVFALSNPHAVRDWIDVRDVAAALVALGQPQAPQGLFNVATGVGHSVREVLGVLCRVGGWHPVLRENTLHVASGVAKSVGSAERLMAATGWAPKIALDDSLRDMIRVGPS